MPTSSARQTGAKNGGPIVRSACASVPDERNIKIVAGPSVPAAFAYAGGHPPATSKTCVKVLFRTIHRVPTHACSS
jgi:hypothetical protein